MADHLVDVVVPVFNGLHVVRPCVTSVLRYSTTGTYRLLLVDDGSDRHTAGVLDGWAAEHPHVEVLRHPRNLGFVHACNTGLAAADAGLVVLLNSDTAVTPRWLEKFRRCFASDDRIGIASPISNFAPHLRIGMLPGTDHVAMNELVEALSPRSYPDVTTPEGYCYAIRRECLAETGPFDVLFDRGYGEESDLAMRANYLGWRTVCVDDTYVYHRGRGTFGQAVRDELYEANKGIFHARWGPRYREDYEDFRTRDVLRELRDRLDALRHPEIEAAFKR